MQKKLKSLSKKQEFCHRIKVYLAHLLQINVVRNYQHS